MNRQDDHVWCIEQLLKKEGFLDPRMYECAQYLATSGRPESKESLYTSWESWKSSHPQDFPLNNSQRNKL